MKGIENMRLPKQFGQINAAKSNYKVNINPNKVEKEKDKPKLTEKLNLF
jgi:hypothetical protein